MISDDIVPSDLSLRWLNLFSYMYSTASATHTFIHTHMWGGVCVCVRGVLTRFFLTSSRNVETPGSEGVTGTRKETFLESRESRR